MFKYLMIISLILTTHCFCMEKDLYEAFSKFADAVREPVDLRKDELIKFFEDKKVDMTVKSDCYISGNYLFSHNLFSPSINADEYFLELDTKEIIFPNHINYISFEPIGLEYWNSKYDNDAKYFQIINGSKISISISLNNLEQIYSINNIDFGINGKFKSEIYGSSDLLKYNQSDLKNEINNCNNKIDLEKKEKFTKDIISLIIYIICIVICILILIKVINLIKNKFNKKNKHSDNFTNNQKNINLDNNICIKCNNKIDDNSKFCSYCENKVDTNIEEIENKKESIPNVLELKINNDDDKNSKKSFFFKVVYRIIAGLLACLGFIAVKVWLITKGISFGEVTLLSLFVFLAIYKIIVGYALKLKSSKIMGIWLIVISVFLIFINQI